MDVSYAVPKNPATNSIPLATFSTSGTNIPPKISPILAVALLILSDIVWFSLNAFNLASSKVSVSLPACSCISRALSVNLASLSLWRIASDNWSTVMFIDSAIACWANTLPVANASLTPSWLSISSAASLNLPANANSLALFKFIVLPVSTWASISFWILFSKSKVPIAILLAVSKVIPSLLASPTAFAIAAGLLPRFIAIWPVMPAASLKSSLEA